MTRPGSENFVVAAVQAKPVILDLQATVDKACDLILEVGANGAKVAVFPEGFLPTYPFWNWYMPPNAFSSLNPLYAELLDNAVTVPGPQLERLADTARAAGVNTVMGFNELNTEASGTSLYNSTIVLGADGRMRGHHRKLVPTGAERTVHAYGDGSTLGVVDIGDVKLGTLICWENMMPLARYALYGMGTEVLAMPSWDHAETFLTAARHIAYEGSVVAISALSPLHVDDVPDREEFEAARFPADGWLHPGRSFIVDPLGTTLAGPLVEREGILYAEVSREMWRAPRAQLDVAGHYGRPDVFDLRVDASPHPMVRAAQAHTGAGSLAQAEAADSVPFDGVATTVQDETDNLTS